MFLPKTDRWRQVAISSESERTFPASKANFLFFVLGLSLDSLLDCFSINFRLIAYALFSQLYQRNWICVLKDAEWASAVNNKSNAVIHNNRFSKKWRNFLLFRWSRRVFFTFPFQFFFSFAVFAEDHCMLRS